MAHWTDYSLRGWLSFLAFMYMGLGLRSISDPNFLFGKIFIRAASSCKESILVHFFGVYACTQAFVLAQAAIYLYVVPVQLITIFILSIFALFVLVEAFYFQSIDFYGGTLLPFSMSVISITWLIVFHYIWKPWIQFEIAEDHQLKNLLHEGKKKCRVQRESWSHQEPRPQYYRAQYPAAPAPMRNDIRYRGKMFRD